MALSQLTCTYTLLAHDPASGCMGIVTASACLAVGASVPFLRPGVGAVATQNLNDPRMAFAILDDLEKRMTFLYRNPQGCVTWAYPVTVDRTPHRVEFSSGEKLYAA